MPLLDSLINFRNAVVEVNSFIAIAFRQDATGAYVLAQNERDFITDSAFLKVFIAWETFLESIFIKYMLGEASINGTIVGRHVNPIDDAHAHRLLIGTQKYVDWSNPEIVRKLCNLYFSPGNHINTHISSIQSELFDLKTIRNAAAHLTSTTNAQLDSLGSRLIGSPQSNLKVSQLIFSQEPTAAAGITILMTYLNKLDIIAENIANG